MLTLKLFAMRCYHLGYCWLSLMGSHGDHPGHGLF